MEKHPAVDKLPVDKLPASPRRYPTGTVRALLETGRVTEATRQALLQRLEQKIPDAPRFFSAGLFQTLQAVCARLVPQDPGQPPIPVAWDIDTRLAEDRGDGWRYADLPPDGEAYRLGLHGLDELARSQSGLSFSDLAPHQQDAILLAVQRGQVTGGGWAQLPAPRFFEELLAEAVESYYSHPLGQEEIGYVGLADAHGWQRLGLNELEDHEPREMKTAGEEP